MAIVKKVYIVHFVWMVVTRPTNRQGSTLHHRQGFTPAQLRRQRQFTPSRDVEDRYFAQEINLAPNACVFHTRYVFCTRCFAHDVHVRFALDILHPREPRVESQAQSSWKHAVNVLIQRSSLVLLVNASDFTIWLDSLARSTEPPDIRLWWSRINP